MALACESVVRAEAYPPACRCARSVVRDAVFRTRKRPEKRARSGGKDRQCGGPRAIVSSGCILVRIRSYAVTNLPEPGFDRTTRLPRPGAERAPRGSGCPPTGRWRLANYLGAAESGRRMRMAGPPDLRSLEALALVGPNLGLGYEAKR